MNNINGSALANSNVEYVGTAKSPFSNGQLSLREKAEIAFQCGYYTDLKNVAQATMKLLVAEDLGIPVTVALQGVHIINGKPVIGANLMASMIQSSGKYRFKINKLDATVADLQLFSKFDGKWEDVGNEKFTIQDAKTAGLNSPTWQKYPKNMLFARAISNAIRFYFPDLFMGNPVYTPEEMGATIDEDGNILDIPAQKIDSAREIQQVEVQEVKEDIKKTTPRRTKKEPVTEPVAEKTVDVEVVQEQEKVIEKTAEIAPTGEISEAEYRKAQYAKIKELMADKSLELDKKACENILKDLCGKTSVVDATIEELDQLIDAITPF